MSFGPTDMSTRILAIDPGPEKSGAVYLARGRVMLAEVLSNAEVLAEVGFVSAFAANILAIEMIAGMGMTVGQSTFETCRWVGRFQQAWRNPEEVTLVYRRDVKTFLCGNQQAKDANVRRALLDMFPPTGGGATPQIGTKANPGPLYNVTSHAWSALAVAVTAAHKLGLRDVMPEMPRQYAGAA